MIWFYRLTSSLIIFSIILAMNPKQLNIRQAEKWLEKLRETDPHSFREFGKCLKRYDKTEDEYQCFVKINTLLISQPVLVQQLNNFLEKGNQIYADPGVDKKIEDFIVKIKSEKPEYMPAILQRLQKWKKMRENTLQQTSEHEIKATIRDLFKNDPETQNEVDKIFTIAPGQIIKRIDLPHLKIKAIHPIEEQIEHSKLTPYNKPKKQIKLRDKQPIEGFKEIQISLRPKKILLFNNPGEQKYAFKQLEKKYSSSFVQLSKILNLYKQAIITVEEFIEQLKDFLEPKELIELKDIIASRENDRRRQSKFKPLCDLDLSLENRVTTSYIEMPNVYSNYSPNQKEWHKQLLNTKYVSVPQGTEEFNIRPKNIFENNMIVSDDTAYECDICEMKIRKTIEILEKFLYTQQTQEVRTALLNKAIKIGMIQYVYKDGTKQHQTQLQLYFKKFPTATIDIILKRLKSRHEELKSIKSIHGYKNWKENISKNYYKALDITANEFKRIDRLQSKVNLLEELKNKAMNLCKRYKNISIFSPFDIDSSRDIFKVFNSFQNILKGERCLKRQLPTPIQYNIEKIQNPLLLPVFIFGFQDTQALAITYSFITYYLQYGGVVQQIEKIKCKSLLQLLLKNFLKFNKFDRRDLSEKFNQEQLMLQISSTKPGQSYSSDLRSWLNVYDDTLQQNHFEVIQSQPYFNSLGDSIPEFSYLPPQTPDCQVLYSTQGFYVFMRFFYALYERIIKLKETLDDANKQILFELLYYTYIRTKQNVRFEESIGSLLRKSSVIYTTFYKLIENTIKNLNGLTNCPITLYCLNLYNQEYCQQICQVMLYRHLLELGLTGLKLIRWTFDGVSRLLYMNLIDFFRKYEENKEILKKHRQINMNTEIYLKDPPQRSMEYQKSEQVGEKKLGEQIIRKNFTQYSIDPKTYTLNPVPNREDILINKSRSPYIDPSYIKLQVAKVLKFTTNFF